jgi:transposase-like protein
MKVQMPELKVLKVDEGPIIDHLNKIVKETMEDTLNRLLDAEADQICGAKRYEHADGRKDTRAGKYSRKLQTRVGEMKLNIPKLRNLPFETAIIERYRRRELSIEEALIEMYLAGVSVRRVEDITEALWGSRVSSSTISDLNKKAYENIEKWRNLPITEEFPYVYLDGISLKRSWGGEVKNVSILVAIGVSRSGYREILGVADGCKEDRDSWLRFLRWLKERGLKGVLLFINDKCLGLVDALGEVYPDTKWQRCVVHFYRNILSSVPRNRMKEVAAMLKAIYAQESREEAVRKAQYVISKLREMKLSTAAKTVEDGHMETFSYYDFPSEHRRSLRTNNPLERINREIRRRTRVVGCFPDGNSALMLVAARLRYISGKEWGTHKYMDMDRLYKRKEDIQIAS